MLKIAVAGKGGVGKTSIAAGLIRLWAEDGPVWAIDADPDACLAAALGVPEADAAKLKPFSEMRAVIRERVGGDGGYMVLNPQVEDLLDRYALVRGNVRLLRMGALKKGGAGCYCRENAFLNAILTSVLVDKQEVVVVDLAAGIEQLSRGAARGVDRMVVVCDPTRAAAATARNIVAMAFDLGIEKVGFVGNRVRNADEREFIRQAAAELPVWGYAGRYEEFAGDMSRAECALELPAGFMRDLEKVREALLQA
ncbi:carbon monoxide dehydrogenase [Desulforudis sp. 1088]|uniref:ATP-binding protein n=1 Tax=unclassified Candidatus Desulforudis TaxID=2635950 RepID=UPI003471E023